MKKRTFLLTFLFLLVFLVSPSRPARAVSEDTRAVLTTSLYGLGIGTLLGAASVPLSRDGRTLFIGSSVGLYLGIAAGLYHITHRDDPENPFNREDLKPPESPLGQTSAPPSLVVLQLPVYRF